MSIRANADQEPGQQPAGLAELRREFGGEYDITQIGLTWYAWRFNARGEPLRASSGGELRGKIEQDRQQPAGRLPHPVPSA